MFVGYCYCSENSLSHKYWSSDVYPSHLQNLSKVLFSMFQFLAAGKQLYKSQCLSIRSFVSSLRHKVSLLRSGMMNGPIIRYVGWASLLVSAISYTSKNCYQHSYDSHFSSTLYFNMANFAVAAALEGCQILCFMHLVSILAGWQAFIAEAAHWKIKAIVSCQCTWIMIWVECRVQLTGGYFYTRSFRDYRACLMMISHITNLHTHYCLPSIRRFDLFSRTNQFLAIRAITMAILCLYQLQMVFIILLIYILKISLEWLLK